MNSLSLFLLALSMSADAFAVSLARGAAQKIKWNQISVVLSQAFFFGLAEGTMPLIGWVLGQGIGHIVEEFDHWIAFSLLVIIGLHMIYESFSDHKENENLTCTTRLCMVFTVMATSIDSLTVGVTLAFLNVHIWSAAASFAGMSFFMSALALSLGGIVGQKLGPYAERAGGLGLILIGAKILAEHLGYL